MERDYRIKRILTHFERQYHTVFCWPSSDFLFVHGPIFSSKRSLLAYRIGIRKPLFMCFDVCRASAVNITFALAFATALQLTFLSF